VKPLLTFSVLISTSVALVRAESSIVFNRDIQPLLAEHCFHCHGKDEGSRKAKMRLDEREAALKGGESDGPAIVPGQPDKSALMARILSHDDDEIIPPHSPASMRVRGGCGARGAEANT